MKFLRCQCKLTYVPDRGSGGYLHFGILRPDQAKHVLWRFFIIDIHILYAVYSNKLSETQVLGLSQFIVYLDYATCVHCNAIRGLFAKVKKGDADPFEHLLVRTHQVID